MKLFVISLICLVAWSRVPVATWDHCKIKKNSIITSKENEIDIIKFEANSVKLRRGDTFKAYITSELIKGKIEAYSFPSIRVKISKGGFVAPEKMYRVCDLLNCPVNEGETRTMEVEYYVPTWIPDMVIEDEESWQVVAEIIQGSTMIECIKFEVEIKE